MATFTYAPDFQSAQESAPQVSKFVAGDGYEQRTQFGLHLSAATWRLAFTKRTDTERDEILAFLEARAAIEGFYWITPSGDRKLFVCAEWQVSQQGYNSSAINATFVEVFES